MKESSNKKWRVTCVIPRQAKPAADEASPAAVGKLLYEAMCRCNLAQSSFVIFIPLFSSSTSQARARISLKHLWNLPPEREISYTNQHNQIPWIKKWTRLTNLNRKLRHTLALSHMRSWWKAELTATVVVVQRWEGSRVRLILSLTGKIKVSSLLPQYLITAMLVGVCAVTMNTQFCDSLAIISISKLYLGANIDLRDLDSIYWDRRIKYWLIILNKMNFR